jgi:hypothetical protein
MGHGESMNPPGEHEAPGEAGNGARPRRGIPRLRAVEQGPS